jgi:CMP/dCMP kinase
VTTRVVAIDGPVGSGKSTVARSLAAALGWSFLDTGAMYRATTAEALGRGIDLSDESALGALAESLVIETVPRVTVNGADVTDRLRSPAVNDAVSVVATVPRVRAAMVAQQRRFATHQAQGTVVEGRDTATVVFPDAEVKIYLTASLAERQRRRGDEDPDSVARRDELDAGRAASPLRLAADAKMVDTTGRSVADVVKEILGWLAPAL